MRVIRSTIAVATNGIAVINKYGGPTNVAGVYRVTNCTIRAFYSVVTDYNPTNFHLSYCNVTASFSGLSNAPPANAALAAVVLGGNGMTTNSPLFISQPNNDYHLQPYSPCIDAGDPLSPIDPDGSRIDVGFYTFVPPTPMLSNPQMLGGGTYQFALNAYTNRNYVVEFSTNTTTWNFLTSSWQFADSTPVNDATATNSPHRIYRARLAP